jgi:arginine exporter protein ArgO
VVVRTLNVVDLGLATTATSAPAVLPALLVGVAAGLGVALPLGAIGVLLLQEGMTGGRRAAMAAATGVATVDLVYAGVAVLAGGAVTEALAGREALVRWTGAIVLAGLAVRGLAGARRPAPDRRTRRPARDRPSHPFSSFLRFVGLTAINPLTAVYFTVLAAGLGQRVSGAAAATAFAIGVFVGSWAWQSVLGLAGSLAGARLPTRARTWTTIAGNGLVLIFAAVLAHSA